MGANYLTVVSGLPRSGTSMLMRMLATGMPALIDDLKPADEHNPNGYYELEAVKYTKQDPSWLLGSEGKVVKLVHRHLYDLPNDREYRVLFMCRDLSEVIESQTRVFGRVEADLQKLYINEFRLLYAWIATQPQIKLIDVSYNAMLVDPFGESIRVSEFLDGAVDASTMATLVDSTLCHIRHSNKLLV